LTIVFLLINCIGGSEKEITSDLQKLPVEICHTFGIFDFVCKIQGKDIESIEKRFKTLEKFIILQVQTQYIPFQNRNNID